MISGHPEEPAPIHSDSEAAKLARAISDSEGEFHRRLRAITALMQDRDNWLKSKQSTFQATGA